MPEVASEIVYRGHDNPVDIRVQYYDEETRRFRPVDLSPVTRMVMVLKASSGDFVIDSAMIPGVLSWESDGRLTARLSQYDIPVGIYPLILVAYDALHTNGQVILDPLDTPTTFEFRDTVSEAQSPLQPLPQPGSGTFVWHQTIALSVWTIPHNLGKYPSVTVTDDNGHAVYPDIQYLDEDIVQVTHGRPMTGWAYLN